MEKNYLFLVVDIETTGQHQTKNDILAIGACIGDSRTNQIIDEFMVFLKPLTGKWEERCVDEFWSKHKYTKQLILEEIDRQGLPAVDAMKKFHDWINNRPAEQLDNLILFTDTCGFDIGFLNYYLSLADLPSMNYIFGNKYKPSRDSSSFHMGVALTSPTVSLWGAEKLAANNLGFELPANPYEADHIPVNDAKAICFDIMEIDKML